MSKKRIVTEAAPDVVLRGHSTPVTCLNFQDGFIFSSSLDATSILWDVAIQRECLVLKNTHSKSVVSCGILQPNSMAFTSGRDGLLKIWDLERKAVLSQFLCGCLHFCNAIVVNEDAKIFAACRDEDKVLV